MVCRSASISSVLIVSMSSRGETRGSRPSRAVAGRRLARRRRRAVAELLPTTTTQAVGVAGGSGTADPGAAQQAEDSRDTPWGDRESLAEIVVARCQHRGMDV